ncbi:MAG TPA: AraC family transcriptional regulator [Blastocatellia bacterium]|nr:AraC family transcriptional regulator [Blastocatellia bacterium]
MHPKTRTIIEFLKLNLHRNVTLKEMTRSAHLSRSRLFYLFKCEVGLPPGQYLKSLRLERARQLLETTMLSVKEVTAAAGFRDQSHFVRDFKKAYELTPSQYRNRHFNQNDEATTTGRKIGQ